MVSNANVAAALRRVEENKGAPGSDGMTVQNLRPYLREHWRELRSALLSGNYRPTPVRRVEIPKPGGGIRLLGIPTAVDRFIQQSLLQVLTPVFDAHFSPSSYGFRPGRRGHDAVRMARQFVQDGWKVVVDLDVEQFFDRVNHDILMARVARRVTDKRVLHLIRAYLKSGVLLNGVVVATDEGTPQGGPLSPLLANVLLDDLDKELERRGHKFVRYADDCNVYVRTRRAGERVKASVTKFLAERLRLTVNEGKSAVALPHRRKFLGFSMELGKRVRIRLAPQSVQRCQAKIRELTSRSRSQSMETRVSRLSSYLRGWLHYFALADTPTPFRRLDKWVRRRLRLCYWKQWKRARTRFKNLRALGLSEFEAWEGAGSKKGLWRLAGSPPLQKALSNAYLAGQGLVCLLDEYHRLRQA
jgi:group II intron reverse transcriptase/maturase